MTLEHFKQLVSEMCPKQWRLGQTAFNTLEMERPSLAEKIRGTAFDPFHDDSALPRFYDWLELYWEPKERE